MPLPPLCGPVLYGSTIGIRSTIDSNPHLPPYYISVPASSRASGLVTSSLTRSAGGQRTPLDDSPAGGITSASAAVTVASTPSPFASSPAQAEREEQATKHFPRLLPLSCCTNHPYGESAASEFCLLNADFSASKSVCEYDEVFLVGGPSLRDFLLPSQQQPPSSLRRGCGVSAQPHKSDAGSSAARRAQAAAADRRTGHLLWVVCCPSKTELHEQQQQQRQQRSPPLPHLLGRNEVLVPERKGSGKQQQQPAEDEEPVRVKSVVCADFKQLQQAVDSHCRWRVLRHSGILTLRHDTAHSTSAAAAKTQQQHTQATAFNTAATDEGAAVGAPLRWDEEVYFQNVRNGCYLSLHQDKQRPWNAEIVALSSAAAAVATTAARRSLPSPTGVAAVADGALATRQVAGQQTRLLQGRAAAAAPAAGSACSAVAGGERETAAPAAAAEQKYSSWRLVLSGIAASPWWNRQYACTLMAPTEIDDCLLRRETLNGVFIAAYLEAADTPFVSPPLRRTAGAREAAAGGGGAAWWLQQRQVLALSPYTSCCKVHVNQEPAGGGGSSAARAAAASAEKSRTNISGSSQQPPLQGGGPASLSESWRQASVFGQQQVGENEWVMRRLQRDWKYLPREVKERFLLEDLLFCLSGIDGTLVRVFAVQDACCCVAAAAFHHASPSSSCSTSDSSRRGSSGTSSSGGCEQLPCYCPRAQYSSTGTTPVHCYNSVRRVLPEFRSWLHPLLTGASCCGSAEAAAAGAGSQHPGGSCRESFQSLYMQRDSSERAAAELLHATGGSSDAFFPSPEDYAFCQILPSLMPAACSLRLLLVFLELAGRSQSTRSSSRKVFSSNSSNADPCAAHCDEGGRPRTLPVRERGALQQRAAARESLPFLRCCDGAAADAAAKATCCEARAEEEEEEEGGGEVLDALCVALRKVVEEIGMQVGVWEGEVRRGRLTLQGLRAQLGPIARAAAVAEQVARLAFGKRGGSILNAIEEVQKSIPCNDSSQEVCRFLFEKAAAPLVGMVLKWIYRGKVVDPYDEFFIVENATVAAEGEPVAWRSGCGSTFSAEGQLQQRLVWSNNSTDHQQQQQQILMLQNCLDWWEQRFVLVSQRIPSFLKLHARDILHAGMYVYVLKSCKWPLHPSDFNLRKTPLPPQLLLPVVPRACVRASRGLMQLFFSPLQLLRTFDLLHAFFLGGRGDFFQSFFDHAAATTPAAAAVAGGAAAAAADGPLATAAKTSAAAPLLPPLLLLRQRNSSSSPLSITNSSSSTKHTLLLQVASLENSMQQAIRSVGAAATQGGTGRFDGLKDKLLFFMHPVASLCEASQLLLRIEEGDNLLRLLGLVPSAAAEEQQQQQTAGAKTAAVTRPSLLYKPTSPSDWHRRLCLRYRCGWPLSLIYSSKALCSYETIFRLLLHLHLAQRQLNHLWAHLHASRSLFSMRDAPANLKLALAIGEEMRFFLRNLLFYASTDVVAHHYGTLLRQLGAADSSSDSGATVSAVLFLPAAAAAAASARDSSAARALLHASSSSSSSSASPRGGGCRQRSFFASVVAAVSSGIPPAAAASPTAAAGGGGAAGVAPASENLQFREVQRLHAHFLDSLLRDLFLKNLPLLQALSKSLTICLVFSRHALKFVVDATQTVETAAAAAHAAAAGLGGSSTAAPGSGDPAGSPVNSSGSKRSSQTAAAASASSSSPFSPAHPAASSSSSTPGKGPPRRFAGFTNIRRNSCRLLLKEERRQHLRSAVSTPGYASMTRSACISFRTHTQEFLTKLQAFSRRDPASVSEHLLCRLDFNGRFSRPCLWLPDSSSKNSNTSHSSSDTGSSSSGNAISYNRCSSGSGNGDRVSQSSSTPDSTASCSSSGRRTRDNSSKFPSETAAAATLVHQGAEDEQGTVTLDSTAAAARGRAVETAAAVREVSRRGEGGGPAAAATAFSLAAGTATDAKQGSWQSFTAKNVPRKSAATSADVTATPAVVSAAAVSSHTAAVEERRQTHQQGQHSGGGLRLKECKYVSPSRSSNTIPVFDRPPPLAAPLREAAAALVRTGGRTTPRGGSTTSGDNSCNTGDTSSSSNSKTFPFHRPTTNFSLRMEKEKEETPAAELLQQNRSTRSGVSARAAGAAAAPFIDRAAAASNITGTARVSSFSSPHEQVSSSIAAVTSYGRTVEGRRAAPAAAPPPAASAPADATRREPTGRDRPACKSAERSTRVLEKEEEEEEKEGYFEEEEEIEEDKLQDGIEEDEITEEVEEDEEIEEEAVEDGEGDEEERLMAEEELGDEEEFKEQGRCTETEKEGHERREFSRWFPAAAPKAAAGRAERGSIGRWQQRLLPREGPDKNPRKNEHTFDPETAAAARGNAAGAATAGSAVAGADEEEEEEEKDFGEEEEDEDDEGEMLENDGTDEEENLLIYSLQHEGKARKRRDAARGVVALNGSDARPIEESEEEEEEEEEEENSSRAAGGGGSYAALHLLHLKREKQKRRAADATAADGSDVQEEAAGSGGGEEESRSEAEEEEIWRRRSSSSSSGRRRGYSQRATIPEVTGKDMWKRGHSHDDEEEEEGEVFGVAEDRWDSRRHENEGRNGGATAAISCSSRSRRDATRGRGTYYLRASAGREAQQKEEASQEEEEEEEREEFFERDEEQEEECHSEEGEFARGAGPGGDRYREGDVSLPQNARQHAIAAAATGRGTGGESFQKSAPAAAAARRVARTYSGPSGTSQGDEMSYMEGLCSRTLPHLHVAAARDAVPGREGAGEGAGGRGQVATAAAFRPTGVAERRAAAPGPAAGAPATAEAVGRHRLEAVPDSGRHTTAAAAKTCYGGATTAATHGYGAAAGTAAENSYALAYLRSRRALG